MPKEKCPFKKHTFCDHKNKHYGIQCNIKGCKEEATKWFSTDELSGDFDMKLKDTFYLCSDHNGMLSEEGDNIMFLNPETGKLRFIELGEYACSETCKICNQ